MDCKLGIPIIAGCVLTTFIAVEVSPYVNLTKGKEAKHIDRHAHRDIVQYIYVGTNQLITSGTTATASFISGDRI